MAESPEVFKVWIALLALCDADGIAKVSKAALPALAHLPKDDVEEAMHILSSPDEDSRTPDHDGRRIERVDGGWLVLNYGKYRGETYKEHERQRKRETYKKKADSPEKSGDLPETSSSISYSSSFLCFYEIYPKKTSKWKAWQVWKERGYDETTLELIKGALKWQKNLFSWRDARGAYIPGIVKYLDEKRWEDEPHD